jgi:hypothetical protein
MKGREWNGVHVGQPVRDLDGTSLGKVIRLFPFGFQARRGLPFFHRREVLVRYDEIRAVRDGALVVARSAQDLFALAAGEIPDAWRIPAPPAFPTAATPAEARDVREDVAAGRVTGAVPAEPRDEAREPPAAEPPGRAPLTEDDVREYVRTRGEAVAPGRGHGDAR